jgi:hypothetical protein
MSLHATEEIAAMDREIESRQRIGWYIGCSLKSKELMRSKTELKIDIYAGGY